MAIKVNILSWPVFRDCQPRLKKGQPPHNTTGVARSNWIQLEPLPEIKCFKPCPPISNITTGIVNINAIQNRRLISRYSGLTTSETVTVSGSKAIPQRGQ